MSESRAIATALAYIKVQLTEPHAITIAVLDRQSRSYRTLQCHPQKDVKALSLSALEMKSICILIPESCPWKILG